MSFIINKSGELVATTAETIKSGKAVSYGFETCKEALNANFESRLVNAKPGKISNAKKWQAIANRTGTPGATDIYKGQAEQHKGNDFLVA